VAHLPLWLEHQLLAATAVLERHQPFLVVVLPMQAVAAVEHTSAA
jgi:hypothetical protein